MRLTDKQRMKIMVLFASDPTPEQLGELFAEIGNEMLNKLEGDDS
jgi:hypothetical protein